MRRSRFSDDPIIGILKEQEAGGEDGGGVPPARHQRADVLPVEIEVWRT